MIEKRKLIEHNIIAVAYVQLLSRRKTYKIDVKDVPCEGAKNS